MWENHKEGWALKNWCFWIGVLEKTLESLLNCKIKPVNPKGNQPWIFTGKDWCWPWSSSTFATWCEKSTHWKDLDVGKEWRQKEKRAAEDEMVGWHHRLNEHEFEPTSGNSEGQGSLASCSPWGCKDWTWLSNWTTTTIMLLELWSEKITFAELR